MQPKKNTDSQMEELQENLPNSEELAKIFDYPAIGELFSDNNSQRLDDFCSRLATARENLERIIRYGDKSQAERADRAIKGIKATTDFLLTLRQMQSEKKS